MFATVRTRKGPEIKRLAEELTRREGRLVTRREAVDAAVTAAVLLAEMGCLRLPDSNEPPRGGIGCVSRKPGPGRARRPAT